MRAAPPFFGIAVGTTSTTLLKILGPGHLSSGQQVRSSDPTSEKLSNRVTATVAGKRFETFRIWYTTKNIHTTCIYRIFFYISHLRSGQFHDLPIMYESIGTNLNASTTYQIRSNSSEPSSIRLLMTSVQLCKYVTPDRSDFYYFFFLKSDEIK